MKVMALPILLLTIVGALLGTIGSAFGNKLLGVASAVIVVLFAFLQFYLTTPYTKTFVEEDWVPVEDEEFALYVPARHHMHNEEIVIVVYRLTEGGPDEAVMCYQVQQREGRFRVLTSMPFRGRLVIK